MKPLSPPSGVSLRLAAALCLLGAPLAAWQPTTDPATADSDSGPPYATVNIYPHPRGDVDIDIYVLNSESPVGLLPILRAGLPCDWSSSSSDDQWELEGTCRHLLANRHGLVDDKLALTPLANAFMAAGIRLIKFTITSKGEPVAQGPVPWLEYKRYKSASANSEKTWRFTAVFGLKPPPFHVLAGTEWKPTRLASPLLFVLLGPATLAFWVRRQMNRKSAAPGSGIVWLNWIMLGSWLTWISAVHIEDISGVASSLSVNNSTLALLIGALLFAVPPLLATTVCMLALAPQAQAGTGSQAQLSRTLRRALAAEATFTLPMGLFLVGTTMMQNDHRTGMLSMVAAYATWRLLAWCAWRWDSQQLYGLVSGELRDRAIAIAQAAKVELKSVFVLENRFPMEANAFAMSGGRISFTRGLLENMSRREVDSVMAHELGHLKGRHIPMRTTLFVAYLVLGPVIANYMVKAGLPGWVLSLPILPMIYVLMAGQLSQSNELNADARAVALTNDPEGTMAALARLTTLTRSPIDWGGIQGSILSHPSMRRRVLSIAQRYGVPEERALAILENPDILSGTSDRDIYELPAYVNRKAAVFTASARMSHAYWTPWVFGTMLLSWMVILAYAAAKTMYLPRGFFWSVAGFFLGLPLVGWLTWKYDDWWDCLFIRRTRRKIEAGAPAAGTPVALLPGDRILPLEAQYAWDLGRITLDDRLTYRGEQTQFSVPRSEITGIEIQKSRAGWCRTHAVVVRTAQCAFSLRLADRGRTRRLARRLEKQLASWWHGESAATVQSPGEAFPAPDLPVIHHAVASRGRIAWVYGVRTVLLFFGTIFLLSSSGAMSGAPLFALIPFTAPIVYAVMMCPGLFRAE